jgi:hypothetical protein
VIRYVLPVPPLYLFSFCLSEIFSPFLSFFRLFVVHVSIVLHSLSLSLDPSYNNLLLFFSLIPSSCSWESRIRCLWLWPCQPFRKLSAEVRVQLANSFSAEPFLLRLRLRTLLRLLVLAVLRMTVGRTASLLCLRPAAFLYVSCQLRVGQSSLAAGSHLVSEITTTGQRANGEKGCGRADQQLRQLFPCPLS